MLINQDRIVNRFMTYVQINSESGKEALFAEFLKNELQAIGFEVVMDNAGEKFGGNCGNLIATFKGELDKEPLMFSAHMDTVSPGNDIKPLIKDEIIWSDGTTVLGGDDKAGIACIVEGIQTMIESGEALPTIQLVFTVAEEGGIKGGKNLDLSYLITKEGFILDSSKLPGEIITNSPGQAKVNVIIHGKAAHAGVCPESGISAVQIFAEAISQMSLQRIDDETTANIGIVTGGTATNIVMDELKVTAEVRSLSLDKLNKQIDHMKTCFDQAAKTYGGTISFDSDLMYGSFNVSDTENVVIKAKKAFSNMGIDATTTFTGGGSDANALNSRGLTMVNLGIGEKKAHTLEEHYYIKDLMTMCQFVIEMIKL